MLIKVTIHRNGQEIWSGKQEEVEKIIDKGKLADVVKLHSSDNQPVVTMKYEDFVSLVKGSE